MLLNSRAMFPRCIDFVVFVMVGTAGRIGSPILTNTEERGGLAMKTENKDIAPLLELLRMAAEEWPSSEAGEVSPSELFRRDQALLKMWPEACRRVGLGEREFPPGVIERWHHEMGQGRAH
jgi:hypothetical protein